MTETVQRLPTEFVQKGYRMRLLKREGNVALYERWRKQGGRKHYEVVIIQIHPARKIMGREYPPRESLPNEEQWGTDAWSLATIEFAEEAFANAVEASKTSAKMPHVR